MIDATLDFEPKEEIPREALETYFKQEMARSEFALMTACNQYQAQLASHKALLDQRDRLLKSQPKAD